VIEHPARDLGVTVEPELIDRLFADASDEPGILALLQQTLVQLWNRQQDQTLTLAAYEALGAGDRSGLAIALARRTDATLREFTEAQELIATSGSALDRHERRRRGLLWSALAALLVLAWAIGMLAAAARHQTGDAKASRREGELVERGEVIARGARQDEEPVRSVAVRSSGPTSCARRRGRLAAACRSCARSRRRTIHSSG